MASSSTVASSVMDDQNTATVTAGQTAATETADQVFTAADVQRLITDAVKGVTARYERKTQRTATEREQAALAPILEAAGVESADELLDRLSGNKDAEKATTKLERKLAQLESRLAEREQTLSQMQRDRESQQVKSAVTRTANKMSCRDSEVLYTLLQAEKRVGIEDGEIVCYDEKGQVSPVLTLEQLVKQTLDDRPYLMAPAPTVGAGSRPAAQGLPPGQDATTREGRLALLASSGIAQRLGLS